MTNAGLSRGCVLAWCMAMAAVVLGGCCPRSEGRPGVRSPVMTSPALAEPRVLEPSGALQLVRAERLASIAPLAPADPSATGASSERDAAAEAGPADDADADADASPAAEDDVRQVVVPRRSPLASPEELFRASIRDAESRRHRILHFDRMLVRTSGPICDCDGSENARAATRTFVDELVTSARPAIEACLAQELARDPRVLVDAPALLVVSQAMSLAPVAYRFVPALHLGPAGVEVRSLGWPDDALGDELGTCLTAALEEADVERPPLTGEHGVRVPLVAFSQRAWGTDVSALNLALAFEAAAVGWQHYERGEHEAALELFRDAHWVLHLGEYRYLEGLALEQLGRFDAAAAAFADYLAERPYAPEAPTLPARIARLRARAHES